MRRRPSRLSIALLAIVALVASACGQSDPTSELADALSDLAEESFAYALTLDLDSAAANELLGPDAGMAAGFVNSLALTGTKAEGAFSFSAGLMGFEPFSVRSYDDGRDVYLRVGVQEILASFGADLDALGLSALADAPGAPGELLSDLLGGEWVGFVDLDPDAMAEQQAEAGANYESFQRLGEDLRVRLEDPEELLRDVTVVTETDVEGGTRYDIDIRTEPAVRELRELFEPLMSAFGEDEADLEADLQELLAEAPETIAGFSATVQDGDLTELRFDVGAMLASLNDTQTEIDPGDMVLSIAFSEHGSATVPERPADANTYTQEEMEELTEFFSDPSNLMGLEDPGGVDVGASLNATDIAQGLAALQMSYQSETGAFTADLETLFGYGPDGLTDTLPSGAVYGACLYDDGAGFVVGVEHDGETAYADDSFAITADATELGCQPELVPLDPAA